jgi:hypothetical protein
MNEFFSFDLFMVYIPECKAIAKNYGITHDMRYSTLEICAVVLLLSESRAIINDLDVILHGFML